MKKMLKSGLSGLCFPVLVVAILIIFLMAVSNLQTGNKEEGKEQLEQAIRRCAVACYAAEGIYPPNIDYMKEHYGIRIDEEQYLVIYDIFAENLMPDITVLVRNDEKNRK